MFTITKEKPKATKLAALCDDCKSFIPVGKLGEWTKCPHCGLQFQVTTTYRKAK